MIKLAEVELTVEELDSDERQTYGSNTVGELLEYIKKNNISMDAKICVERIHDFYYENNHWGTIRKPSRLFDDCVNEYTPIWCTVKYPDDKNLYLDLHY